MSAGLQLDHTVEGNEYIFTFMLHFDDVCKTNDDFVLQSLKVVTFVFAVG